MFDLHGSDFPVVGKQSLPPDRLIGYTISLFSDISFYINVNMIIFTSRISMVSIAKRE